MPEEVDNDGLLANVQQAGRCYVGGIRVCRLDTDQWSINTHQELTQDQLFM